MPYLPDGRWTPDADEPITLPAGLVLPVLNVLGQFPAAQTGAHFVALGQEIEKQLPAIKAREDAARAAAASPPAAPETPVAPLPVDEATTDGSTPTNVDAATAA